MFLKQQFGCPLTVQFEVLGYIGGKSTVPTYAENSLSVLQKGSWGETNAAIMHNRIHNNIKNLLPTLRGKGGYQIILSKGKNAAKH